MCLFIQGHQYRPISVTHIDLYVQWLVMPEAQAALKVLIQRTWVFQHWSPTVDGCYNIHQQQSQLRDREVCDSSTCQNVSGSLTLASMPTAIWFQTDDCCHYVMLLHSLERWLERQISVRIPDRNFVPKRWCVYLLSDSLIKILTQIREFISLPRRPHVNFISGQNGSGKSAVLQAIQQVTVLGG